jgi:nucleoside-diphosphate-sugar epimerase
MVFTSSIAPYGASEQLKEESTLPTPNTPYGISKLVAEKIHIAWQKGGADRKLTIVRPGVVFGRGENGNFSRLYWGIRKHTFAYPGRKDTIKACVYVKELVRFILWNVEERQTPFDIFNCTFEPAYTIEQIVTAMKKVTGLAQSVPYIPNAIIMPAAACAKMVGSPMGICPARVKKLQISTNICGKKMASSGYQFKYTFEEALADWYNDNNGKYLE